MNEGFIELSKKNRDVFFNQYINEANASLEWLRGVVSEEREDLLDSFSDYSTDVLLNLVGYLFDNIDSEGDREKSNRRETASNEDISAYPLFMRLAPTRPKAPSVPDRLSLKTAKLINGMGYYWSYCFTEHYSHISWDIWTDSSQLEHLPVLVGIDSPMNPVRLLLRIAMGRSINPALFGMDRMEGVVKYWEEIAQKLDDSLSPSDDEIFDVVKISDVNFEVVFDESIASDQTDTLDRVVLVLQSLSNVAKAYRDDREVIKVQGTISAVGLKQIISNFIDKEAHSRASK